MRSPSPRKIPKPSRKPGPFDQERILTRTLPPTLLRERRLEGYHLVGFDWSGADLSGRLFSDCLFESCNLAGAVLANTSLQNVAFERCKLLGLPFHTCNDLLFEVHFDGCGLDYASFAGKWMPNTRFVTCSLQEANFAQTDLTNAVFEDCLLRGAVFEGTRLNGADLRTAQDVMLDLDLNELTGARFALHSLPGLVAKYGLLID